MILDLSHNKISDNGTSKLCQILGDENCKIRHLDLSNNHINVSGAQSIGKLLQKSRLETINLRLNYINEGAKHIFEGMIKNTSLSKINLSGNFLENSSVQSLLDLVRQNRTIIELDLTCNPNLTEQALSPIVNVLSLQNSIQVLSLQKCGVSQEFLVSVTDAIRKKHSDTTVL